MTWLARWTEIAQLPHSWFISFKVKALQVCSSSCKPAVRYLYQLAQLAGTIGLATRNPIVTNRQNIKSLVSVVGQSHVCTCRSTRRRCWDWQKPNSSELSPTWNFKQTRTNQSEVTSLILIYFKQDSTTKTPSLIKSCCPRKWLASLAEVCWSCWLHWLRSAG